MRGKGSSALTTKVDGITNETRWGENNGIPHGCSVNSFANSQNIYASWRSIEGPFPSTKRRYFGDVLHFSLVDFSIRPIPPIFSIQSNHRINPQNHAFLPNL